MSFWESVKGFFHCEKKNMQTNKYNRLDMSEWVIHFVHDRKSEDDLYAMRDISKLEDPDVNFVIPSYYDENGVAHDLTDEYDDEWPVAEDATAFDILQKIIHDGFIRSGWSMRDLMPTVYGPYSAVCFTEMPLYGLIEYARFRGKLSGYVGNYGIAFLRKELFDAGARQVIYGLSTDYKEAEDATDSYFGRGMRCLSDKCGIGLEEQYRYVSTNLGKGKRIDWTHEREWRWPLKGSDFGVNGMPFLLAKEWGYQFSQIVIIVSNDDEQREILDQLKNMYDSGGRNCGIGYNMSLLPAVRVLSLETLAKSKLKTDFVRIEDVPTLQAEVKTRIPVSEKTRRLVDAAMKEVSKVHDDAIDNYMKQNPDYKTPQFNWGSAYVYTWGNTEVTQALLDAGIASTYADGNYMFKVGRSVFDDMDLEIIGARAAADYLRAKLKQGFNVYEYPD